MLLSTGTTPNIIKHHFISLLIFCVISLISVIYLPYLGATAFVHEEPRRALIARDMALSGDYLVPRLKDEAYLSKPPLYNWIIVASGKLFGEINEFSARVTSVFALMLLVIAMIFLTKSFLNKKSLVFLSLALVLAPEIANKARLAEIELLFTLLVTLSIWVWFYYYEKGERALKLWIPASVLTGLAFITKREPAILFFYLSVFGYLYYQGAWRYLYSWQSFAGLLIMVSIASLWVVPLLKEVGLQGMIENAQAEVIQRELSGQFAEYFVNVLSYPIEIFVALLPFSLLLLLLFSKAVRIQLLKEQRNAMVFCCISILMNIPIYLVRGDIAVRYFLPMFPTIIILFSLIFQSINQVSNNATVNMAVLRLQKSLYLITTLILLVSMVYLIIYSGQDGYIGTLGRVSILSGIGLFFALVLWLTKKFWCNTTKGLLPAIVMFACFVQIVYFTIQLPRHANNIDVGRNVSLLVKAVEDLVPRDQLPLQTLGNVPYDVWYYLPSESIVQEASQAASPYFLGFKHLLDEETMMYQPLFELPYRGKVLVLGYRFY